jgi:hypothetical protein
MKTVKYILALTLTGLLSLQVFAFGGATLSNTANAETVSMAKFNHNLVKLLTMNEIENPSGVAILTYAINEQGVITISNVEASDDALLKYVYRHLEGKKVKLFEGVRVGEHSLTVHIKSGY